MDEDGYEFNLDHDLTKHKGFLKQPLAILFESWTLEYDMAGSAFKLPRARPSGAPYFSRNQVAAVLHQVAVLLALQGANVFRVRSYQNGSRLIGTLTEDLHELVVTGRLFEM